MNTNSISLGLLKKAQNFSPDISARNLYVPLFIEQTAQAQIVDNNQITEDILTVINKLSEKFKESFDTVTNPEVYERLNESVQQMDPADLARIGAMLGGGVVGFRRALAGDSPSKVFRGVAAGALLGAAGGYFLPTILDALTGIKTGSYIDIDASDSDFVKKAVVQLIIPILMVVTAFGLGVIATQYLYTKPITAEYKSQISSLNAELKTQLENKGRLEERLRQLQNQPSSLSSTQGFAALNSIINPATVAGGGLGALFGYLYAKAKNKGKEEEEEKISPLVSSLVGGGLGSAAGYLANKAFSQYGAI